MDLIVIFHDIVYIVVIMLAVSAAAKPHNLFYLIALDSILLVIVVCIFIFNNRCILTTLHAKTNGLHPCHPYNFILMRPFTQVESEKRFCTDDNMKNECRINSIADLKSKLVTLMLVIFLHLYVLFKRT